MHRFISILTLLFIACAFSVDAASVRSANAGRSAVGKVVAARPASTFVSRVFRAADRKAEKFLHLLPPAFQPAPEGDDESVPTNKMANISLICGLVGYLGFAAALPAALITGIIALNQIRDSGEQGKGRAIAGIIMGGAPIAVAILVFAWMNGQ